MKIYIEAEVKFDKGAESTIDKRELESLVAGAISECEAVEDKAWVEIVSVLFDGEQKRPKTTGKIKQPIYGWTCIRCRGAVAKKPDSPEKLCRCLEPKLIPPPAGALAGDVLGYFRGKKIVLRPR